jgi:hypothetical protein
VLELVSISAKKRKLPDLLELRVMLHRNGCG